MYYLKMLLRLTTLVFPLYIICAVIALFISFQGGDLSHWPYAFHPAFEFLKSSSDHSNDVAMTNLFIIGNIIMCSFLTKSFTANIQYENSLVEFVGGPLAIFFLISWFNPSLYEITSFPGELIGFYIAMCIVINIFLLVFGKKLMGIPGLKFGSGFISAYNKQAERYIENNKIRENATTTNNTAPIEENKPREEKIVKVTEMGSSINVTTSYGDGTGSGRGYRGKLINWTSDSITVHEESGWVTTYNAKGQRINSYYKK